MLNQAEEATGCLGAGDSPTWTRQQGWTHCEVYDHTSSAGDWTFIVSKDGYEWFIMSQCNNWPRPGFTRTVDHHRAFFGSKEEVFEQLSYL